MNINIEKQEIKEKLISMYNDNKYFMNLKSNDTITSVQLDKWLEFQNYIIDKSIIRIYSYNIKQLYEIIENKINDIDNTVNEIYIRQIKENIKVSDEYKQLDNYRRYCYKIQQLIGIKISEVIHSKYIHLYKLINKDVLLNRLKLSYDYWINEDLKISMQIKELLSIN